MFIVQTSTGETYTEKNGFYWSHIPKEAKISSLSLTHPFKITFQSTPEPVSIIPKFVLKGYDEYYFSNEQTVSLMACNGKLSTRGTTLTAKIVAGIKGNIVTEFRMDKSGNIVSRVFDRKELEDGSFDLGSIRKGLTA